jgi:penicillin-binding protein 1A
MLAAFMVTACAALLGGLVAGVYSSMAQVLPSPSDISGIHPSEGVRVFSADGVLLGRVAKENRQFVPIKEIPTDLQLACIAVEDRRFYQHHGVDPKGIVAAVRDNILGRRIVRGASTITQQLARSVYLSPKRTIARKTQEIILALEIERTFSKEEILELYLNQIYYGNGAYGVRVAAETYFDKPVGELSLAQCALLAGIPQRPSDYNPFQNPEAATRRRNEVLSRMQEQGYITADEAESAKEEPLRLGRPKRPLGVSKYKAPYFTDFVLRQLAEEHGADVIYRNDLNIYTTLDWGMQAAAERAVREGVSRARGLHVSEGALVAMDYRTGAVKALVGGLDYSKDQYSCATQARRQAGSAFKIFVYTTAMDNGYTPESVFRDSPVSYPGARGKPWRPQNADRRYRGPITLRSALAQSVNVIAVKLMAEVGVQRVVDYAHRMGIRDPLDPYLSLALGTSGVTALDMATGMGVLANQGRKAEPMMVTRVTDRNDNVLFSYAPETHQVLSEATAGVMDDMLRDVITRGTGRRARIAWPAAGKTGTASDYKDAWFIGYTDQLVCAVWVGNRDNTPMHRVFGGTVPAAIWADFMSDAMRIIEQRSGPTQARPEEPQQRPTAARRSGESAGRTLRLRICADSGKLARTQCPNTKLVDYPPERRDLAPRTYCDIHGPAPAPRTPSSAERTITLSICADSGKLATEYCPRVINKEFVPSAAPSAACDIHKPPPDQRDADGTLW